MDGGREGGRKGGMNEGREGGREVRIIYILYVPCNLGICTICRLRKETYTV